MKTIIILMLATLLAACGGGGGGDEGSVPGPSTPPPINRVFLVQNEMSKFCADHGGALMGAEMAGVKEPWDFLQVPVCCGDGTSATLQFDGNAKLIGTLMLAPDALVNQWPACKRG